MPEKQWATVQFPDGRRVQRQIPAAMSDRELRGLFAEDYMKSGYDEPGAVVHKDPNPLMGWGQNDWSLSNYRPSLGERLETSIGRALGDTRRSHRFANKAFSFVNDATPVGNATGIDEGGRQVYQGLSRGDLGQAALGAGVFALSALPVPGAAKRATKKATAGIFGNLARNTDGAIRAWHGSPHDFDRFDMSRIGTGEGAQAYGHGLYFAENPDTARSYRDALITRDIEANGWNMKVGGKTVEQIYNDLERRAARMPFPAAQVEYDKMTALESLMQHGDPLGVIDSGQIDGDALNWFRRDIAPSFKRDGRLYEVNINAEPEDFLDWDAPLSGMSPEARARIQSNFSLRDAFNVYSHRERPVARQLTRQVWDDPTGDFIYHHMPVGDKKPTHQFPNERLNGFRDMGFAGIKYLDQGSRGAGNGTRNYVVFDDGLIDILNKY